MLPSADFESAASTNFATPASGSDYSGFMTIQPAERANLTPAAITDEQNNASIFIH
jgi:hypothetical protein